MLGYTLAAGAAGEAVVADFGLGLLDANKQIARVLAKHKARSSDEATYLAATLREGGQIGFGDADPARTLMDRFLANTGEPWEFDLATLFAQDKGARARVYSEVVRRTLRLLTQREKLALAKTQGRGVLAPAEQRRLANLPVPGTGVLSKAELDRTLDSAIDPVITIFQPNFSTPGWWGGLGTFPIRYTQLRASGDGSRLFVRLEGENSYDWHPGDARRATQPLHQIAARLIQIGAAKPFPMRAKPRTYVVNVLSQSMEDIAIWYTDVQANAPGGRGRTDQLLRLIGSHF